MDCYLIQVFVVILLVTGLCDLGYTVYQDASGDYGGVAQFLYLSSAVLAVTMVSPHAHCVHLLLLYTCTCSCGFFFFSLLTMRGQLQFC